MKITKTTVRVLGDGCIELRPRDQRTAGKHHLFGKAEANWRHQTRMPSGHDRDWQRTKVYTAERLVRVGEPMTWEQTLRFLAKVLNSATFQRRWGIRAVQVHDGRGRTRAAALGSSAIYLPRWARTPDVILHELAHIVSPNWEQHGRLFVRTFLELTRLVQGKEVHDRLRESFRDHGVRFTPRRKTDFTRAKGKVRRRVADPFDPFRDLLGL